MYDTKTIYIGLFIGGCAIIACIITYAYINNVFGIRKEGYTDNTELTVSGVEFVDSIINLASTNQMTSKTAMILLDKFALSDGAMGDDLEEFRKAIHSNRLQSGGSDSEQLSNISLSLHLNDE